MSDIKTDNLRARADAWARRRLAAIGKTGGFGTKRHFDCLGTGVCVANGLVLTAHHVTEGAQTLSIKIAGRIVSGAVVHEDRQHDLSLVRLAEEIGQPVVFAFGQDSSLSQHGHLVAALGYPASEGTDQFSLSRFQPKHFDMPQHDRPGAATGILEVQGGLEEGYSGGPFMMIEHDLMPIVGQSQRGGRAGFSQVRGATHLVHYLWAHDVQPVIKPWWDLIRRSLATPSESQRLWAGALGLPGKHATVLLGPPMAELEQRFTLVPNADGRPVLMAQSVLPLGAIGLPNAGAALTGLNPADLPRLFAHLGPGWRLRLPTFDEWRTAHTPPDREAPPPWPAGRETLVGKRVPPRGLPGPFGVQMAPLGHWELVSEADGTLSIVAPPLEIGGPPRKRTLSGLGETGGVVQRVCLDLPQNALEQTLTAAKWER
ncbi:serine protease [uncultured Roseobacter sp.]|uniref:S1 family peptidase n=1 Tax=uncultured Roseobacter sp. TaxID=114847 RepID=UPI00262423FF|nr:serine protease [uncultured Roseobacter sp.]